MDISLFAFDDQAVPHLVYDLSIPLPERREKAMWFKSGHAAANWLGIPPKRLYTARAAGHRVTKDGKQYAIRIAPKGNGNNSDG
jgi:hypothetical protein